MVGRATFEGFRDEGSFRLVEETSADGGARFEPARAIDFRRAD